MEKAYLVLQNGKVFEGTAFGAKTDSVGELVFHTAMIGYVETMTDPVCAGQILVQTFPLFGCYGVNEADFAGPCRLSGCIAREWCPAPSNFRSQYDVNEFLVKNGVPGLYGIDTRALTEILREEGTMNAAILHELPDDLTDVLAKLAAYRVTDVFPAPAAKTVIPAEGGTKYRAALIDLGASAGLPEALAKHGCEVTVLPYTATADEVLALAPDFAVLSSGAGDPELWTDAVASVRGLLGKLPILAFGLGHQILALAAGGATEKLKYGHRGGNQPVRDLLGTRTYITAQNHGYAVTAAPGGVIRYANANDGTCEGIDYPDLRSVSVQFRPDGRQTDDLLARFFAQMTSVPEDSEEKGGADDAT